METIKKNKNFDAVKMMCEIRDKINVDTKDMTFEELKEYIKIQLAKKKTKLVGT